MSTLEALPELLDVKRIMSEMGVTRATAEALMRQAPTVRLPGLRKNFVKRTDLLAVLDEYTYANDRVPA